MDGCAQKVYAASTETGRGLIKQHVQEHANVKVNTSTSTSTSATATMSSRQAQIELVMDEEQRLRLPVKYVSFFSYRVPLNWFFVLT